MLRLLVNFGKRTVFHLGLRSQRQQVLILAGDQVRAIQREQRLTLVHDLSRIVHKELFHPSRDPQVDMRNAFFVVVHSADRPDGGLQRTCLDHGCLDPNQLLFRRRHHGIGLGRTSFLAGRHRHPLQAALLLLRLALIGRLLVRGKDLVSLPSGHEP